MKWIFYFNLILIVLSTQKVSASDSLYVHAQESFRQVSYFNEIIEIANPDLERINAVLFYLTNEERSKKRLNTLSYQRALENSATLHSNSMLEHEFFDHINKKEKNFKTPNDRARIAGISNPYLAENIIESFVLQYKPGQKVYPGAKGIFRYKPESEPIQAHTYLSLGESMMHDWMHSPHHRENILSKKALQLGCGSAFFLKVDFNDMPTIIATQNFQQFENVIVDDSVTSRQ